MGGFRPLSRGFGIEWDLYFPMDGSTPQLSRRIDTKITGPLFQLPVVVDPKRRSLALLNLLRGRALGLPSGQDVAEAMGTAGPDVDLGLGGRIVAEVLLGMLAADPASFINASPAWAPTLPAAESGRFTMADLLRFAGR